MVVMNLPLLAADLSFVKSAAGRAYSGMADWDYEQQLCVGDHVLAADGSRGPTEAIVEEIRSDGTIVLNVLAFSRTATAVV